MYVYIWNDFMNKLIIQDKGEWGVNFIFLFFIFPIEGGEQPRGPQIS